MRPKTIGDVVGNKEAVSIIKSKTPETMQKVFLISGNPGCAKTSLARIIFDILGGEDECIHEYNMATEGVKATVREIESSLNFKPSIGKINGWLFDEAHKATSDTLSGFLKPLEDSHDFNYFIFCTSDISAFLKKFTAEERKAFLRRCTELKVGPITDDEGFDMIADCLDKMDISSDQVSDDVIEEILAVSGGVPSNMYKNLETVMDLEAENQMIDYLKSINQDSEEYTPEIKEISRAILDGNWSECCKIINQFKKSKTDIVSSVRRPVMGYMQSVLLNDTTLVNNLQHKRAYAVIEMLKNIDYEGGIYAFTTAARYACLVGRN